MARLRLYRRVTGWLRGLVQEVPDHLAVCEFDCEVLDCRIQDWRACSKLAQQMSDGGHRTVVPKRRRWHRRPAARTRPAASYESESTPLKQA
jgi:hypothetical protein